MSKRSEILDLRVLVLLLPTLLFGCKTYHTADTDIQTIRIEDGTTEADVSISELIAPYKEQLSKVMDEPLCYNQVRMQKGKPESSLTNWVTDAIMQSAKEHYGEAIDFAVQNYGGIRIRNLGQGDVTVGKIFELMPFDNLMLVLTMDSSEVHTLCNKMASVGGWPISRELNFVIANDSAKNITINDVPLNGSQDYQVVIPDYIANGGDRLYFLKELPREDKGVLIRDALLDIARRADTIPAIILDQRIRIQE
jgi:2',3'-cyclic-nucleotide 2'-phosphodiesterase (5'-nucleotidase family)